MRKNNNIIIISIIILFSLIACKKVKSSPIQATKPTTIVKNSPLSYYVNKNEKINNLANFISGKPIANSRLKAYLTTAWYKRYKSSLAKVWASFSMRQIHKIKTWEAKNLNSLHYNLTFYPFGGPDLINALTFYPRARYYILMGLEPGGSLAEPDKITSHEAQLGLALLSNSLEKILGHNFFHTKLMQKRIGRTGFNGIVPIFFFFITSAGYEVVDYQTLYLKSNGEFVKEKSVDANMQAHCIYFRTKSGQIKTAIYFQGDISDGNFYNLAGLNKFSAKNLPMVTLLKAASYLMFRNSFDDIRNFILTYSSTVLQGPSGIPYHYLTKKSFKLTLFGTYVKPIPLFKMRNQPDLARASKLANNSRLPFQYDYTAPRYNRSIIMLATNSSVDISLFHYDKSNTNGENTYSNKGRLFFDKK